jgi:hypothetical protein
MSVTSRRASLLLSLIAGASDVYSSGSGLLAGYLNDYHHVSWTVENGLGAVFDIQQSSDGYLWLTTANGAFRFDGVRFQSIEEVTAGTIRNQDIDCVFVGRDAAIC